MAKKTQKMRRGGEPQFRTDPSGRRGQAAYYSHVAPKAARKQLSKQPPGRRAASIGPGGWKEGGAVKTKKMQRGGRSEATHMASGNPIQWQSGPTGQRRKADYMSYVAPKVARKQLRGQAAAGGPGRGAVRAAGPGGKAGGAVKNMKGGGTVSYNDLIRSKGW